MTGALALSGVGFAWPAEVVRDLGPELPAEVRFARAAARGDREAFARLVDLYKRPVLGLCARLLGDREEARDAAQETFVRAWGAIGTYDAGQPFAPWVLRIARNLCLDAVRRRAQLGRPVELDATPAGGEPALELADRSVTPADERLAQAELAASVGVAVAALPANYREVIQLFHVEHLSYKEIAAVMDVPIGTVMTWLHRARSKLREAIVSREERP